MVLTAVDQLPGKVVHCFQFLLTFVLSTQLFPTALTPVLSSLYEYYMIDKHNKLLSSLRFLWNLKMLYVISLLVIYDTLISLICFFFMLFLIYLFWSSLQCVGFSFQWLCSLWSMGSRNKGLVVCEFVVHRLFLCNMWDFSRPGIEPVSPASTGRYLTTGPPRKSLLLSFSSSFFTYIKDT